MWRGLVVAGALAALAGCGGEEGEQQAPATTTETSASRFAEPAAQAVRDVGAGEAQLLDVRTDEEFDAGHAADTLHLPLDRIEAGDLPDVRKGETLYVYCRTGNRAGVAVERLRAAGYTDVTNIGGLRDWEQAGGETTGG